MIFQEEILKHLFCANLPKRTEQNVQCIPKLPYFVFFTMERVFFSKFYLNAC